VKEVIEKPTLDDQNKTFRTRLVSIWMLSNAILAVSIQNINGVENTSDPDADEEALRNKQNFYFAVILYSTFGLSMVRFIGVSFLLDSSWEKRTEMISVQCLFYFLKRNLFRWCRRN
jgi:chitin synthase